MMTIKNLKCYPLKSLGITYEVPTATVIIKVGIYFYIINYYKYIFC